MGRCCNLGQLDLVRRLQDRSPQRYPGEASDGTCALGSTGASTGWVDTLAGDGCQPGTEGACPSCPPFPARTQSARLLTGAAGGTRDINVCPPGSGSPQPCARSPSSPKR